MDTKAHRETEPEVALRERVKELTCLYGISLLAQRRDASLDEILTDVVKLLPPAWQYPDHACARIAIDERSWQTDGFRETGWKQSAEIIIAGQKRGLVCVAYSPDAPVESPESPFLREEQHLIEAVARQVGLIVERREAERRQAQLQEQLRHADRLATIGQLSAGVAHELNEPLGNILGFAELVEKEPALPEQARRDVRKIKGAALHAREVIRKLMMFARPAPPRKERINLNRVVTDGLYLLESRCAKSGIDLVMSLAPDLPEIVADAGQVNQVLVNLAVNAIQAMPRGGRLTVRTLKEAGYVVLSVEDTGIGMTPDVRRQLFIPFFTTKDVSEGTGLGLSVVHGIVTAHGGSIRVESAVGKGSRFDVRLPVADLNAEERGRSR